MDPSGPTRNNKYSFRSGKALLSDGTEINIFDYFYEWFNNGVLINDTIPVETLEQDNTAPAFIGYINIIHHQTTLAEDAALDDDRVVVVDATGIAPGDLIVFVNAANLRYGSAEVLSVTGTLIILDSPLEFAFLEGDGVSSRTFDLAVDGSDAPVVFSVKGALEIDIPVEIDISRIIITCLTLSVISLSEFGDIPKLIKGLLFRKRDGVVSNIFNIKSNQELAGLTYDFDPYLGTNPAQGQNGFVSRLTFNGQEKMGVAIRIGMDEDLEVWVQDDLTGIQSLQIVVQGHVVI